MITDQTINSGDLPVDMLDMLVLKETLQELRKAGYGPLLDILQDGTKKVYTKKGRINKSEICRELKWSPKYLTKVLKDIQIHIADEEEDGDEE